MTRCMVCDAPESHEVLHYTNEWLCVACRYWAITRIWSRTRVLDLWAIGA